MLTALLEYISLGLLKSQKVQRRALWLLRHCLIRTSTEIHFLLAHESCIHACNTQKHQVLDHIDGHAGLLLQTAFYRCCRITRMHFSAPRGINRTTWGTRLLLTAALWIVPVWVPAALLLESKWLL